jgi:hypothetical protein
VAVNAREITATVVEGGTKFQLLAMLPSCDDMIAPDRVEEMVRQQVEAEMRRYGLQGEVVFVTADVAYPDLDEAEQP